MTALRLFLPRALCLVTTAANSTAAEPSQPLVVAHRGLLRHAPENTLSNFRACLTLRFGFEFDVRKTKDGRLVCIHDNTVDRTTSGTGKVSELTFAEIRKLDAGNWFDRKFAGEKVPIVAEVLELASEHRQHDFLIRADLKAERVEHEVIELAKKYQLLEKILFISGTASETATRNRIRQISLEAHVAVITNDPEEFRKALMAPNADWIKVRYLPSREETELASERGKKVFIAGPTVSGNLPENWLHAAEAGVEAILTDYPLELWITLRNNAPKK